MIVNVYNIVIIAIASYTITYMIRYTDGPFDAFKKLRTISGVMYDLVYIDSYETVVETIADTYSAKLISCFWCLCTWVSILLWILHYYAMFICEIFAIIGMANIIHILVNNINGE